MNQAEEDALVNEIFDKSWRTEPGAQTSLFNMAESIRLAIRAAVAAERERDEARELSVQGSARLFAAMNFERDEWKRKAEEAARDAARLDAIADYRVIVEPIGEPNRPLFTVQSSLTALRECIDEIAAKGEA